MAPARFIDSATLPDISGASMDLLDSSFFQSAGASQARARRLPTPESIIKRYGEGCGSSRVILISDPYPMAVKIGSTAKIRLEEVQTMWAMRKFLPQGQIAIPEVFGWRHHNTKIFIYMSRMDGVTLRNAWDSLTNNDKTVIQLELRRFVAQLRDIAPKRPQQIASISGGLVQDRFFWPEYARGPFPTVKSFNDWIFAAATRHPPAEVDVPICGLDHPDMLRDMLPDNARVYFAHGDLVPLNIMVAGKPGSFHVSAVVDWEQAGWYPEYWEYCKMHFGAGLDTEWRQENWPAKITKPHKDANFAFEDYYMWRSGGM